MFALVVLLGCVAVCGWAGTEEAIRAFTPAEATEVSEITVPLSGQANGTVVLDALIAEEGKPQRIEVRRENPGLTSLARDAVKDWTFIPAKLNGKSITSRVAVAVTFNPAGSLAEPVPLPRLLPQSAEAIQAEFQPPDVVRAAFPKYPHATTVAGAVVIQIVLDEKGAVGAVQVLKDLPPLTDSTREAIADWRFRPATQNGTPVPSKIVLAFVFHPWSRDKAS